MKRRLSFVALALSLAASPAFAGCSQSDPSGSVSPEAWRIISLRNAKKAQAGAAIDRSTSKLLQQRMLDPKTGKTKNLPVAQMAQYRRDAKYFAMLLRSEEAEARAKADELFRGVYKPCMTAFQPDVSGGSKQRLGSKSPSSAVEVSASRK